LALQANQPNSDFHFVDFPQGGALRSQLFVGKLGDQDLSAKIN